RPRANHSFPDVFDILRNADHAVRVVAHETCSHEMVGNDTRFLRRRAGCLKDRCGEGKKPIVGYNEIHQFQRFSQGLTLKRLYEGGGFAASEMSERGAR